MLTVIGGTYIESCQNPNYHRLYGSGLRAVLGLANKRFALNFHTAIGGDDIETLLSICDPYEISVSPTEISETIIFEYEHPLSRVRSSFEAHQSVAKLPQIEADNVLWYGMIEAETKVTAEYLVYDPQNHLSLRGTGSKINHLALVLNKKESYLLSGLPVSTALKDVGAELLVKEGAEVVVIKNGPRGALAIQKNRVDEIPVFITSSVWPIGSGDIFSAAFAWQWIINKRPAHEAARLASLHTAYYCETRRLPMTEDIVDKQPSVTGESLRKVYLAAPFFNMQDRWLVSQFYAALEDLEIEVFSPYHELGILIDGEQNTQTVKEIVKRDLDALSESDVVLGILTGMDPGTLFEIGYAVALNKRIVLFAENVTNNDLTMFSGSNCLITDDFSSAAYHASWK